MKEILIWKMEAANGDIDSIDSDNDSDVDGEIGSDAGDDGDVGVDAEGGDGEDDAHDADRDPNASKEAHELVEHLKKYDVPIPTFMKSSLAPVLGATLTPSMYSAILNDMRGLMEHSGIDYSSVEFGQNTCPDWELFEYICALRTVTLPWTKIPFIAKDHFGLRMSDDGQDTAGYVIGNDDKTPELIITQCKMRFGSKGVKAGEIKQFIGNANHSKTFFDEARLIYYPSNVRGVNAFQNGRVSGKVHGDKLLTRAPYISIPFALGTIKKYINAALHYSIDMSSLDTGPCVNSPRHYQVCAVAFMEGRLTSTDDTDIEFIATSILDRPVSPLFSDPSAFLITPPPASTPASLEQVDDDRRFEIREWEKLEAKKSIKYGCNRAVVLSIACGCGKTDIQAMYINRNPGRKIVTFVPTLALLYQTAETYRVYGIDPVLLGTGHNESITIDVIQSKKVFICVNDSMGYLTPNAWGGVPITFDTAIFDEAHIVYRPMFYRKDADIGFDAATAISSDIDTSKLKGWKKRQIAARNFNARLKVFMSGTLDESDFGYLADQATKDKYITQSVLHIPYYTRSITDERVADLLLREEYIKMYKTVFLYVNSRDRGKALCEYMMSRGISTYYIDGETPKMVRDNLLSSFGNGEFRALVSVQVLGLGISVRRADTVFFVEPRRSRNGFIQNSSRANRLFPGKIQYNIIVPTCEGEEEELCNIMKIMKDVDSSYAHAINSGPSSCRISIEAPSSPDSDCDLISEAIFDRFGKIIRSDWNFKYELLLKYAAEAGKTPPWGARYNGIALGKWCHTCRMAYKNRKMDNERIRKLEGVRGWQWDHHDAAWNSKFELLLKYVDETEAIPPQDARYNDVSLGEWCSDCRRAYKRGKMNEERVKKLEGIRGWQWDQHGAAWNSKFELLLKYTHEHEKCPTVRTSYNGVALGEWCGKRRMEHKQGILNDERIEKLESIPSWWWERSQMKFCDRLVEVMRMAQVPEYRILLLHLGVRELDEWMKRKLNLCLQEWNGQ